MAISGIDSYPLELGLSEMLDQDVWMAWEATGIKATIDISHLRRLLPDLTGLLLFLA